MPTSLTLDTARFDDGKLRLVAAGEIDLCSIDAFNQALSTATTRVRTRPARTTAERIQSQPPDRSMAYTD
jgi:hypothetical protein